MTLIKADSLDMMMLISGSFMTFALVIMARFIVRQIRKYLLPIMRDLLVQY